MRSVCCLAGRKQANQASNRSLMFTGCCLYLFTSTIAIVSKTSLQTVKLTWEAAMPDSEDSGLLETAAFIREQTAAVSRSVPP